MNNRVLSLLSTIALAVSIHAQPLWQTCTMPSGLMLNMDVGPAGELVTLAGGSGNQPFVSNDQGATWSQKAGTGLASGISDMRVGVSNTGTILVVGTGPQGSRVWRSTDGGDTFTAIGTSGGVPSSYFAFGIAKGKASGECYIYGEGVMRSTDDGLTWTSIVSSSLEVHGVAATTNSLIGAAYPDLFKCAHDGSGYAVVNIAPLAMSPKWDVAVGYNDRIVVVGGTTNKAITSTDDGATWTDAGALLFNPTEMRYVAASTVEDQWICGKQNNMYFCAAGQPNVNANNGISWIGNEPLLGTLVDPAGTFYMYTYSQIRKLQISTGLEAKPALPTLGAYPNPVVDELTVNAAGRMYRVTDLQGRLLSQGVVPFGGRIAMNGLANGLYLVNVDGFATTRVQKL
jgi:hypothetical protein